MDRPLPAPKKAAAELKKLAPKVIKEWHVKFANDYNLLELGFNYLKNCKKVLSFVKSRVVLNYFFLIRFYYFKVDFVSFSHQTVAQRAYLQKQNEKQEILQNRKYVEYVKEMNGKLQLIDHSIRHK